MNVAVPLATGTTCNNCQVSKLVEPNTDTCVAPGAVMANWMCWFVPTASELVTMVGASMTLKLAWLVAVNWVLVTLVIVIV